MEKTDQQIIFMFTGNCSSCNAVFSVLKKRVRLKMCTVLSSFNFVILFFWPKFQHDVSYCYRGTAVTVATASVHDAAASRCSDLAWVQQVRQKSRN